MEKNRADSTLFLFLLFFRPDLCPTHCGGIDTSLLASLRSAVADLANRKRFVGSLRSSQ
ncbi:MAG: hypothetical protein FWE84_00540 [Firmicutes bacterium]|nr:hypothetical protein [Bacillota bacterium]